MTHFRTEIKPKKETQLIDYHSNLLLIGSCFTDNIGKQLTSHKFNATVNPWGILFHPKAIENLISSSIHQKKYTENDLVFHNNSWYSFDAHSSFSDADESVILSNLNTTLKETRQRLLNATHVIVTLGTAWVYRHLETNNVVANCHKIPQHQFKKELLSVDEITESLHTIITLITSVNSSAKVVFTVSPIRHIKNGFVENKLSKAHLLASIHQTNATYFPAYEIMMDDLRDYRFYKKDLIHPNETAINYIWDKFVSTWMHDTAIPIMNEVQQIQKGLAHKPFNESSESHQCFLRDLQSKIDELEELYGIVF